MEPIDGPGQRHTGVAEIRENRRRTPTDRTGAVDQNPARSPTTVDELAKLPDSRSEARIRIFERQMEIFEIGRIQTRKLPGTVHDMRDPRPAKPLPIFRMGSISKIKMFHYLPHGCLRPVNRG
jgi:hypothetical protein